MLNGQLERSNRTIAGLHRTLADMQHREQQLEDRLEQGRLRFDHIRSIAAYEVNPEQGVFLVPRRWE